MSFPYGNIYRTVEAKTASYACVPGDLGKILTNRGAGGAITITLPPVTSPTLPHGWWVDVFAVAGQNLTVASAGSNDNIVTFNDAAADSVSFETASEIIGGSARFIWDGTGWLCQLFVNETQTPVIA